MGGTNLIPFGMFVVAAATTTIAFQQWQIARNKLRLDLFDRRYKVFEATRKFLAVIIQDATFKDPQLYEFYGGTSDAEFLFDSDVVDYLANIRKRAIDLRTTQKVYEPLPVGDQRSRLVEKEHQSLLWLGEQMTGVTKVFRPYLGFSHIK